MWQPGVSGAERAGEIEVRSDPPEICVFEPESRVYRGSESLGALGERPPVRVCGRSMWPPLSGDGSVQGPVGSMMN